MAEGHHQHGRCGGFHLGSFASIGMLPKRSCALGTLRRTERPATAWLRACAVPPALAGQSSTLRRAIGKCVPSKLPRVPPSRTLSTWIRATKGPEQSRASSGSTLLFLNLQSASDTIDNVKVRKPCSALKPLTFSAAPAERPRFRTRTGPSMQFSRLTAVSFQSRTVSLMYEEGIPPDQPRA